MSYLLNPKEIQLRHCVGEKARRLAFLERHGLSIPKWAVLLPDALFSSLKPDQLEALSKATAPRERHAVLNGFEFHPSVLDDLEFLLMKMCPEKEMLAIRTSWEGADPLRASTGQGKDPSFLAVPPEMESIKRYILGVWRSAFEQRGDGLESPADGKDRICDVQIPAVILQRMITSDTAGLAQGVNPETGTADITVISACYGVSLRPESGNNNYDTFYVGGHGEVLRQSLGEKELAYRVNPQSDLGGIAEEPVSPESAAEPTLSKRQLAAIQKLTLTAGKRLGHPQDIEWAFEGKKLYLLESYPSATPLSQAPYRSMTESEARGPLSCLRRIGSYLLPIGKRND